MAAREGILIAVEGIDGAGKTTQVALLRDALIKAGESVVCSKEPTDGHWGRIIRHSAQNGRLSPEDEVRAFVEDRKEHVERLISPALDRGEIVLLDRYFYSTIAYQGSRMGNVDMLARDMRALAPNPDIVILIDVDPAISLHRISSSRGETPNTFERLENLREVRGIFLRLAESDPAIHVLNGHESIPTVHQHITHLMLETVLKSKRCAKSYGCDVFFCSYQMNGECRWAEIYASLSPRNKPVNA